MCLTYDAYCSRCAVVAFKCCCPRPLIWHPFCEICDGHFHMISFDEAFLHHVPRRSSPLKCDEEGCGENLLSLRYNWIPDHVRPCESCYRVDNQVDVVPCSRGCGKFAHEECMLPYVKRPDLHMCAQCAQTHDEENGDMKDDDMLAEVEEDSLIQEPQEMQGSSVGPAEDETHPALRNTMNEYLQAMTVVAENAVSGKLPMRLEDQKSLLSLCRRIDNALGAKTTSADCFEMLIFEVDNFMNSMTQIVPRRS
jgi:hypothetical protein